MRCLNAICLVLASFAASGAISARAADLWHVYQLVQKNTPLLRQAEADYKAAVENKPIARSNLLPRLSANAARQRDRERGSQPTVNEQGSVVQQKIGLTAFTTHAELRLDQTLFNWQDWVALAKADAQAAQAAAVYDAARQDVIIQTAKAYFSVLQARDILRVTKADEQALAKQLYQAKRRYQVGLSGIVDVHQAQGAHDQARVSVLQKRQALTAARQTLQALTKVPVVNLQGPGKTLPLNPPTPNNVTKWVDTALQQNADLAAAKLKARVAAKEVDRQQAVRFPTVSVFANRFVDDVSSDNLFQNQNLTDNGIGIQIEWPIFSGGAIAARSRQAKYQHVSAEAARNQQALQVRSDTYSDFQNVLSGIATVKALRESVKSNAASLHATEAAFKVGSETTLDVLRARENLLNAQTAYAQARYAYLLSMLQLKRDAGTLSPEDVQAVNEYFTEPPLDGKQRSDGGSSAFFTGTAGKDDVSQARRDFLASKKNPPSSLRKQRGGQEHGIEENGT